MPGQSILKQEIGRFLLHILRTVFDEWRHCKGHPARKSASRESRSMGYGQAPSDRLLVRRSDRVALRARGKTAVDLYE